MSPIPDIFFAEGQSIISARVAEILSRFDLGNGALTLLLKGYSKVTTRPRSREPISPGYSAARRGHFWKPTLRLQGRTARAGGTGAYFPFKMSDGAIAVSRDALGGPDVWVDPLLLKSIFVSGALGDAMDAAGLREALCLFKCQVT